MNYKEEQEMELETIESIYTDETTVLAREPYIKFSVDIQTENNENILKCKLVFEYVENYPDAVPKITIEDEDFDKKISEKLLEKLKETAEENIGMVMIFQLVSTALEQLNIVGDEIKLEEERKEAEKKHAEEEAERKRFEGTRVTIESFLTWRQKFEAEKDLEKKYKEEKDNKKLTGRELFLRDKTLNESDLKFLEEGDDVKVDESLFEDLDELELDDLEDDS